MEMAALLVASSRRSSNMWKTLSARANIEGGGADSSAIGSIRESIPGLSKVSQRGCGIQRPVPVIVLSQIQ